MKHSCCCGTRRCFLFTITLLSLALCSGVSAAADLLVSGPVTISADTTFTNVVVQSGGVLTANAVITVTADMTIESGGLVTHTLRHQAGLVLDVTGTLDVQSGGVIQVDGRGLLGGRQPGNALARGEAYDPVTLTVIAGARNSNAGAGGGFGGDGADGSSNQLTNEAYGVLEASSLLGSGGGGGNDVNGTSRGGNGGGRITITSGSLNVDGEIRANGAAGSTGFRLGGPGGGSGGSIAIAVGSLTSLAGTGVIEARGGSPDYS